MSDGITGLCQDHSFEAADDVCRRCGMEYCEMCLVFPLGPKKPLCKECAMAAGGVRSHVTRLPMAKRDLKKKVKAFGSRIERGAAGLGADPSPAGTPAPVEPVITDPLAPAEEIPVTVPSDGAVDDFAAAADDVPPPPPPPSVPAEPAETAEPAEPQGVAPPIDWSQPFG